MASKKTCVENELIALKGARLLLDVNSIRYMDRVSINTEVLPATGFFWRRQGPPY